VLVYFEYSSPCCFESRLLRFKGVQCSLGWLQLNSQSIISGVWNLSCTTRTLFALWVLCFRLDVAWTKMHVSCVEFSCQQCIQLFENFISSVITTLSYSLLWDVDKWKKIFMCMCKICNVYIHTHTHTQNWISHSYGCNLLAHFRYSLFSTFGNNPCRYQVLSTLECLCICFCSAGNHTEHCTWLASTVHSTEPHSALEYLPIEEKPKKHKE
jgi:hypothetical protein